MSNSPAHSGAVSAVFGGCLSLMGILIAVMSIFRTQFSDAGSLAGELPSSLWILAYGSIAIFLLAAWCASLSLLYLFNRRFVGLTVHVGSIVWPAYAMIIGATVGIIIWALSEYGGI